MEINTAVDIGDFLDTISARRMAWSFAGCHFRFLQSGIRREQVINGKFTDFVQKVGREIGVIRPSDGIDIAIDLKTGEKGQILQRLEYRAVKMFFQIDYSHFIIFETNLQFVIA
jgi:hypothetical protein